MGKLHAESEDVWKRAGLGDLLIHLLIGVELIDSAV